MGKEIKRRNDFIFKQGTTFQPFDFTIIDVDGKPMDLTGCSVRLTVADSKNIVMDKPMTIGPNIGEVSYDLQSTDIVAAGNYNMEIVVTFPNGKKEIFPDDDYMKLKVSSTLTGGIGDVVTPSQYDVIMSNYDQLSAEVNQKASSVNGVNPDTGGDVQIPVPVSLDELTDNSTHRTVTDDQIALLYELSTSTVKSINNIPADPNGNINIDATNLSGLSIERPVDPKLGTFYFDTTIGKPIWYKGSGVWVDSTGSNLPAPDTTPPSEVTSLSVGATTSSSIVLNWVLSASGDVANYEIYYSIDGGVNYTLASKTVLASATSYTVTGLASSTSYMFKIIGVDTSGNKSVGATTTGLTISGTLTPVLSDDFARADSTTSPGTTDSYKGGTNKAWTVFGSGGLGINAGRIYAPTGTGQGFLDAGIADARMEATVTNVGNGHNFYFRVDSNGRYYRYAYNASGWYLQEQNSTFTTVDTITGGPVLKANDVVAIEVQGTTSKLYVNNVLIRTNTLADLLTNTGFGIGFSSTPLGYADNFVVSPLTSVPASGGGGGTPPSGATATGPITAKPLSYVEVTAYGATGSDSTDVTSKIQSAINDASSKGTALSFPAGTYWINPATGLTIPSNMTIWFDQGATVKALGTSSSTYFMLKIWNATNVKILGYPTLVGDKTLHVGTGGESGMGFGLANSSNVLIENANVTNCWGDGIYIGDNTGAAVPYNKDITVLNSIFDANRRQGMSVISAVNLTVKNCKFTNTTGNTAGPCAGVDFEPNRVNQLFQNVNFDSCTFTNNQGHGIWGDFYYINASANPVSINITNSIVSGNLGQIYGTPGVQSQIATRSTVKGYVKVNGTFIYNK
jgi:hypothetical protein